MPLGFPAPSLDPAPFFGDYDIRGRFPEDVGPVEINHLATAFAQAGSGPLLIGRDVRRESARVELLLRSALRDRGRPVTSLGVQPTGAIAFAASYFRCTALALTPSHNAVGYMGIKAFGPGGKLYTHEWKGIRELYLRSVSQKSRPLTKIVRGARHSAPSTPGRHWTAAYLDHLTRRRFTSLSLVIDSRGGTTTYWAPRALKRMGARIESLHSRYSPTFYGLSPEPTPADVHSLGAKVRACGTDFGATFDGDGDRVAFVDGSARWVEPEVVATFLHRQLSPPTKPLVASVDASLRCEQVVPTIRSPVGSRYVLDRMKHSGAVIGFEGSGHFYLPKLDPNSDGVLVACVLAALLERTGRSLDELVEEFGPIFRESRALSFRSRSEALLAYDALCRQNAGEMLEPGVDGVLLRAECGTILLRVSNTQPVIRVTLEAGDRSGLRRLRRSLGGLFRGTPFEGKRFPPVPRR
jgi:phosphomannomutase